MTHESGSRGAMSWLDERTSSSGEALDGTVFELRSLVVHRNALMSAANPEDVRNISPWIRSDEARALKESGGPDALAAADVLSPPFHPYCRTTVGISASGYTTTTKAPRPPLPEGRTDEDRLKSFIGACDPLDPHLYAQDWAHGARHSVVLGQYIGSDGLAEGTAYRQPWIQGLGRSTWPTYQPPQRDAWWRLLPGAGCGSWVLGTDEGPPSGAVQGKIWRRWLRAQQHRKPGQAG
jgi:hypothetical protein